MLDGMLNIKYIQFIAGIGVCLFLICSGYGLEESYKKNGLKDFWRKKVIKVYLPFCIIELIGMTIFYKFSLKDYLLDIAFIKRITSYSWYMLYIIICYFIFYVWKRISLKLNISENKAMIMLLSFFICWFILDSIFFANPLMPFLRARQMLAFPLGILLSKKRKEIKNLLSYKIRSYILIMVFVICGCFFMGITQISFIKNLNYIIQNTLSIFTVFPITLSIIIIAYYNSKIISNRFFKALGKYSFEIYLIHSFTLALITPSIISLLLFLVITLISTYAYHKILERIKIL